MTENLALDQKLTDLRTHLKNLGSVLVAFSGGVDSTLLAKVAQEVLGDEALAVTLTSIMFPAWEQEEAQTLARTLGLQHDTIEVDVLGLESICTNPEDRCYHCKLALFKELKAFGEEKGLACVVDGSNVDDCADYRPGKKALLELGVVSPLLDVGLTKAEIRKISKDMGLATAEKPAYACLASRIPYFSRITAEKLRQVGEGEAVMRALGFTQMRLRHHGDVARLEVLPDQFELAMTEREVLTRELKALGFQYVALDLLGYRMGSLNEGLI